MNERDLLRLMTPDQRAEWRTARRTGGDTFLHIGAPDSGSDGLFWPYCDETWCGQWVGTCFDVCDGKACVFDWSCDSDGDWNYEYRCPLREYTDKSWQKDYEGAQATMQRYYQDVVETGEDPLNEFYIKRSVKRRERWTFQFANSILGMLLVKARRNGSVFAPKDLPKHVREYAGVTRVVRRGPAAGCARVHWTKGDVVLSRNGRRTETIEREVPRDPARVARDLKAAARRNLAREKTKIQAG